MKAAYVLLFASLIVAVSMVQAQRRMLLQGTSWGVATPAQTGVSTSGETGTEPVENATEPAPSSITGGSEGVATDEAAAPLANANASPAAQPGDIPTTTNDGNTDSGSEQQGDVTNGGSTPAVDQSTANSGFNDDKDKKPRHVKKDKKPKESKEDSGSGDSPPSQADAALRAVLGAVLLQHNTYRASHDVPPLSWNSTLASSAQAWADSCTRQHSGDYNQGRVGENIASGYPDFSAAVQAWYDEGSNYDYTADSYNTATQDFTQLVWKSTTSLGCGLSPCSGSPMYVCQYYPRGNAAGQFTQNVFPPTS